MIDDRQKLEENRELEPLGYPPPPATNDDASFAIPALILGALLILGGYFLVTYNSDTVRTASNTPAVERSAPAPTAPPPATPAPTR